MEQRSNKKALIKIILGVLLIITNISVFISPTIDYPEEGVRGRAFPVIEEEEFTSFFEDTEDEDIDMEWLREANRRVYLYIPHRFEKVRFNENYLLWLGGLITDKLHTTNLPGRVFRRQYGLCSEAAYLLKDRVEEAGLDVRFIKLFGHVVLEVNLDDKWYVADPDYGVVYNVSLDELERRSGADRIRRRMLRRGHSTTTVEGVVELFTESDNEKMPIGGPLSRKHYFIELAAEIFKWLIPVFLITAGLAGIRRRKFQEDYPAEKN